MPAPALRTLPRPSQRSGPRRSGTVLSARAARELESLVEVLKSVKQGDFSVRIRHQKDGIVSRVGELLNDIIGLNEDMTGEFVRVGKIVGQEGKMTERVSLGSAKGAWATGVASVNQLIGDLVQPTNEVARVITAVARGDLSQKMFLEIDGRPVQAASSSASARPSTRWWTSSTRSPRR